VLWLVLLLLSACGDGGSDAAVIPLSPPKSAAFLAAEKRCGGDGRAKEPRVEWWEPVECGNGLTCCLRPDRGSEYDPATNTIRLAGGSGRIHTRDGWSTCQEWMERHNLPCELENSASWQNPKIKVKLDRCVTPC
jgi:hypothetical protein